MIAMKSKQTDEDADKASNFIRFESTCSRQLFDCRPAAADWQQVLNRFARQLSFGGKVRILASLSTIKSKPKEKFKGVKNLLDQWIIIRDCNH